jgi:hypothetical protein
MEIQYPKDSSQVESEGSAATVPVELSPGSSLPIFVSVMSLLLFTNIKMEWHKDWI